ncbi:cobalamin biosynthesis protein [Brucella pseudogrignonensis]|uniref:cobalamin biosynthesis protein n=1 Tax=Brucella pseudogrignonensis TaxID=419475 RepID=UPI0028B375FA|nr:cobalamin biosynthesis protein [Brucella pseudogrignonensis]MDT6938897.1 cobalamin biosynthesis protein [Brucella pseudogrignonensis]
MGCSSGVSLEELILLADKVLASAGVERPAVISTIITKQGDLVWGQLSHHYDCEMCFFDAARLEQETPNLKHPSDVVFATVGCHGVAESAALAAAGVDAELVVRKTTSERATAAIAVTRSI